MQRTQDFQIDMHTNVKGVCDKNAALLATILVYLACKLKLDTNLANEKKLADLLEKLKKNSAVPKNMSRSIAGTTFLGISINLSSFAWNKQDMELYLEVKFNKTDFITASDSEFIRMCKNLLTVAEQYIDDLADRNITEQTLKDAGDLLEDFVTKRKNFIDNRRGHADILEELTEQIKTTNFDLKSMDSIINSLSQSQPALSRDYWSARNMPSPTASKIVFKGKVFDSETNQPLVGASVTLTQASDSKSLSSGADLVKSVKIKSAGGGFQFKNVPDGAYLVTVKCPGYEDRQVQSYVREGVLTMLMLPLTKLPE